MPRSKQAAPSRKRPLSEAEADDALAAHIASDLEAAEIDAVRARHASGAAREMAEEDDDVVGGDSPFAGLVRLGTLAGEDIDALRRLHYAIVERMGGSLAGWGGSGDTSGSSRSGGGGSSAPARPTDPKAALRASVTAWAPSCSFFAFS